MLRVAGQQFNTGNPLRLLAYDCTGFNLLADSGQVGIPFDYVATVRWIGQNVFVAYYSPSIQKYTYGPGFSLTQTLSGSHIIFSLYEYGPSYMIGLGYPTSNSNQVGVVLYNWNSFATVR